MNESDNSQNNQNQGHEQTREHDWKARFNELVQSCQNELKRTTQIGMKMLSASQSNANLRDAYEELGRLAKNCIADTSLKWDNPQALELAEKIEKLEKELEGLEEDVQNIKKT